MVATVETGALTGVAAWGVSVEVSETRGLPGLEIVGCAEAALRESRVRVMAALANSGLKLPERRFIINLAPADLRKSGSSFDLAIAVALLAASGMCAPNQLDRTLVLGELALDGRLRSARGVLAQLRAAQARGLTGAIVPDADASWASLVPDLEVHSAGQLKDVVEFLNGVHKLARVRFANGPPPPRTLHDLCEVCGQAAAKRALEVAAAGGHNLLMVGPPGAGKSMLASRLPSIMPEPDPHEALEIATIASVGGLERPCEGIARPFRAPHHTCSDVALIGGGSPVRPGEVTLAHGGVLFLDELPEFRRATIEALRPTMESGLAVVVRARERVTMPAQPIVVAAMNPCPCGYSGDPKRACRCTFQQVERYRGRVSGPMIDRFDIHVQLPPVPVQSLEQMSGNETSATVRARVGEARRCALERERERERLVEQARPRSALGLLKHVEAPGRALLVRSIDALGLSLRAFSKVLRVSRTVADLAGSDAIRSDHVAEAIQYRLLDRDGASSQRAVRSPLRAVRVSS